MKPSDDIIAIDSSLAVAPPPPPAGGLALPGGKNGSEKSKKLNKQFQIWHVRYDLCHAYNY